MKYVIPIIFMTMITGALRAQEKISFTVSFSEPQAHYADVEMDLQGLKGPHVDVKMPVWTPGSYLIREFAKNVEAFEAVNTQGSRLETEKIDKSTWRINLKGQKQVKVKYKVYSFEVSVRTPFVDASHAFLSPTGIFMYPAGMINKPSTIKIIPHKTWSKISTGLEKVAGKVDEFTAPNFDILYDSPIEVGNQDIFEFEATGVMHEVAMYGGGNYNKSQLSAEMRKIAEAQTAIFGVNPNKRYVFIVHNFSSGGGGLEHLNSTVLGATRNAYQTEAGNVRFLSLVSHEYFHLWNVKRLRPIALGPFNYDEENYTSSLWIAEGFTAYYQNVIVQRTGLISRDQYLALLAGNINSVENQPGVKVQSLSESSFDAWIKQYRPNENSQNTTISYYSKGSLLAMLIDLEIINATKAKAGLDEVMRAMYEEYYVQKDRGFTDAEFKAMIEKISDRSFDSVYDDYVNGLKTIDYAKYLGYAGYQLIDEAATVNAPYLGFSSSVRGGKTIVSAVNRGSGAWDAGINVNDEILALDGKDLAHIYDPRNPEIEKVLAKKKVGETMEVSIMRDGLLQTVKVPIIRNPGLRYRIASVENPTSQQLAVRERWLKK